MERTRPIPTGVLNDSDAAYVRGFRSADHMRAHDQETRDRAERKRVEWERRAPEREAERLLEEKRLRHQPMQWLQSVIQNITDSARAPRRKRRGDSRGRRITDIAEATGRKRARWPSIIR